MAHMIGVYGGTFDPVHFGHLRPALDIQHALALTEIRFIPSGIPPHRPPPQATSSQRLAMLRAAIQGQDDFTIDDREIRRDGPSYMVDTLESLRQDLGPEVLCLIIGMDAFLGLPEWYQWQRLIELAHIVVTHRPGWDLAKIRSADSGLMDLLGDARAESVEVLQRYRQGCIFFQPVTQLDISSTRIRKLLHEGRDVRYLLPDNVIEVIKKQQIYG